MGIAIAFEMVHQGTTLSLMPTSGIRRLINKCELNKSLSRLPEVEWSSPVKQTLLDENIIHKNLVNSQSQNEVDVKGSHVKHSEDFILKYQAKSQLSKMKALNARDQSSHIVEDDNCLLMSSNENEESLVFSKNINKKHEASRPYKFAQN